MNIRAKRNYMYKTGTEGSGMIDYQYQLPNKHRKQKNAHGGREGDDDSCKSISIRNKIKCS